MSDSESKQIDVAGQSTAAEPRLALREALTELAANLAAAGGVPFHMISMSWTTPDPLRNDASRLIHKGGTSVDMPLWSCRMSDRGPIIPGNRPAAEKPRSQERATDHGPS
jgi:hypothetical protein